ncbi:hypothetical protein ABBQ32_006252 [Trebouxia sp. C0010 RCD-2024]
MKECGASVYTFSHHCCAIGLSGLSGMVFEAKNELEQYLSFINLIYARSTECIVCIHTQLFDRRLQTESLQFQDRVIATVCAIVYSAPGVIPDVSSAAPATCWR